MNKKQDHKPSGQVNDEDFSASMARLAELATKGMGPDKPKQDATAGVDDVLLKEFMTPKRKVKPKGFADKWAGKTVKLNINPYVASGIMIVILSVGIIAAPKISKHFEEQSRKQEAEQLRVASVANNTEDKLKSYNVFDAAKDIGGNKELEATSMKDLLKKVDEGNKAAAEKAAAEEAVQVAMNTFSVETEEFQIDLSGETFSDLELTVYSASDLNNPEYSWELQELADITASSFNSRQICPPISSEIPNDESIVSDVIQSYFVFGGKNC